jgi:hypothetical protein
MVFLQWQGAIREPLTITSQEHLIFDIAGGQGSPLTFLAYIGPNQLSQDLGPHLQSNDGYLRRQGSHEDEDCSHRYVVTRNASFSHRYAEIWS